MKEMMMMMMTMMMKMIQRILRILLLCHLVFLSSIFNFVSLFPFIFTWILLFIFSFHFSPISPHLSQRSFTLCSLCSWRLWGSGKPFRGKTFLVQKQILERKSRGSRKGKGRHWWMGEESFGSENWRSQVFSLFAGFSWEKFASCFPPQIYISFSNSTPSLLRIGMKNIPSAFMCGWVEPPKFSFIFFNHFCVCNQFSPEIFYFWYFLFSIKSSKKKKKEKEQRTKKKGCCWSFFYSNFQFSFSYPLVTKKLF